LRFEKKKTASKNIEIIEMYRLHIQNYLPISEDGTSIKSLGTLQQQLFLSFCPG
jgi:hypothetical protein